MSSSFLRLAAERYSCRSFQKREVEDYLVNSILEAARLAPTAKNIQPVHIWVIRNPEVLESLKKATACTFDAPVIFLVGYKPDEAWVRGYDGKNGGETDAAIVGTHIMLQAADLGLGCTWVGSFNPAVVQELLPQTSGYELEALFPVGYPAGNPSPRHNQRKPIPEIVEFI